MDVGSEARVASVADGVFFAVPRSLPRGRHDLSRQQVDAAHRERLMIAATELLAAYGPDGIGVRQICSRAAASRAAFYACFEDKYACVFAAYDRFIATIEHRVVEVRPQDTTGLRDPEQVIAAYLRLLQQDLVTARAFQVEMDAFGREARARRRRSLHGLAQLLAQSGEDPGATDAAALRRYVGAVYAVRQTASDLLDTEAAPDLEQVLREVLPWVEQLLEPARPA